MAPVEVDAALARRFANNLVLIRKRADISQEELGFRASLHRTEVGMLERGIRLPRIDTVIKLAGALEVAPADLLDGMAWDLPSPMATGRFVARSEQGKPKRKQSASQSQQGKQPKA